MCLQFPEVCNVWQQADRPVPPYQTVKGSELHTDIDSNTWPETLRAFFMQYVKCKVGPAFTRENYLGTAIQYGNSDFSKNV
jgi:hypothetical protein